LTEDITTRQESIDSQFAAKEEAEKKLIDRMDKIEVAMKRVSTPDSAIDQKEMADQKKEAKQFLIEVMAVKDKIGTKGASYDRVENLDVDVKQFSEYKQSFERFLRKDERLITPENLKALSVGSDPDGGYTVTPAISNRIFTRLFEGDPIRQLASNETISTGALEWDVDWGQAGFGWEGETETGAETDTPQWFKKRIPVYTMYAKPRASQTLLEDSGINIENWLADKVASRFLRGESATFVTGNSAAQPRGFLTYADGVNYGQIERTNMGAAAALTADGFADVKYSLIEEYLSRGTWLMNRLTVADAMKLKDGSGAYIWKPGLSDDPAGSTILGLPVRMATTMPVVAANALSVAIADWTEAYMIVDRLGVTIQRDPYTAKPMVEFYTRKRVGGDVANFQAIKIGVVAV
jgi:HK97 family phage major capsid protein